MTERPAPSQAGTWAVFKTYTKEVLRYPWLFSLTVAAMLLLQVAQVASPLFLRRFFNLLAGMQATHDVMLELFITLGFIALFSFLSWLARRVQVFTLNYLESGVMLRLYEKAFTYLLGHSYRFFSNQFGGTLTRRVSKFAGSFEAIFDSFVFNLVPTTLFMIGSITVLSLRNLTLGMLLLGWTVVFVGIQAFFARMRQPIRRVRAEQDSRVTGALADAITNQNTVSLFSALPFEVKRFRDVVMDWRRATIRSWNTDELVWTVLGFLMTVIEIGMLYGALIYWQRGLLTVGDFALIQAYLIGAFDRLLSINQMLRRFHDAIADAGEMLAILEEPHEVADAPDAKPLEVTAGNVTFASVDFAFNPDRPIFEDFTLQIPGGQKLALVGHSGAGKSTVTRLLLRLYDVQEGTITIDRQDIRKVTQDSLRENIAYVPQEPILFHRTLLENIRYGRRDATDEEVVEAAKQAHCHEFIRELPDAYDTYVGERGVKLSGGERQRVAIARAILKNAPILILDEATSSLDSESEALIQDALERLMHGKTVIAIAHRLSTIMRMDRIVVMDAGKAVLSGTHEELLAAGDNIYKKLWEIQAGGFIPDGGE